MEKERTDVHGSTYTGRGNWLVEIGIWLVITVLGVIEFALFIASVSFCEWLLSLAINQEVILVSSFGVLVMAALVGIWTILNYCPYDDLRNKIFSSKRFVLIMEEVIWLLWAGVFLSTAFELVFGFLDESSLTNWSVREWWQWWMFIAVFRQVDKKINTRKNVTSLIKRSTTNKN